MRRETGQTIILTSFTCWSLFLADLLYFKLKYFRLQQLKRAPQIRKKARLRHHQCRGKGGERIALISTSHILTQLMETGRRAPDLGFVLPWKLKLRKTGAGGDLHATSPLSRSAQDPICSPCWSLMFWGMVTKYPKSK